MPQTFAKIVSRKSEEISSHDFAEFNLVVNFERTTKNKNKVRKMKHALSSEKRARIIDREAVKSNKLIHLSFYIYRAIRSFDHKSASSGNNSGIKD